MKKTKKRGKNREKRNPSAGTLAALALFIGFLPLASGFEVSRAWCDAMSWFRNWMWY